MAMGVPLIGAIYENDPLVGLYTLPLLVWYPLQLLIGSYFCHYLKSFVSSEKWRLLLEEGRTRKGRANSENVLCSEGEQSDCFSLSSESDTSAPNLETDMELGPDCYKPSNQFPKHSVIFLHESDPDPDPDTASDESSTERINSDTFDDFIIFTPSVPKRKVFRPCPDSGSGLAAPAPPAHSDSAQKNLDLEPETPLISARTMLMMALPPPPL
jgi:hypothetical protein